MRCQIPPKGKITLKDRESEGPRHVSETGNEVPGKHFFELVCCLRCGTILLKPHIGSLFFGAVLAAKFYNHSDVASIVFVYSDSVFFKEVRSNDDNRGNSTPVVSGGGWSSLLSNY